jgi:plasmid stabilization system protein ParE
MIYRVVIPQEVHEAIDAQVQYLINEGAPRDRVDDWLARLFDRIQSLDKMPRRFPVAEAVTAAKGYEVRRVNHGQYALFYRIDDSHRVVEFIAFRHGRQRPWLEDDIGEGEFES